MKDFRLKLLFLLVMFIVFLSVGQETPAQEAFTPPKGSAERKAIFDGVRKYRKSSSEVYIPESLWVQNGWAFTNFPDPNEPEVDTLHSYLLLRKTGKAWKVLGEMEFKEGETREQAVKRFRKKFPAAPINIFH